MNASTPAALALLMIPAVLTAAASGRKKEFAPYSYVWRSAAEKGAPANDHPLRVDPAALRQALLGLRVVAGAKEAPLFAPDETGPLADALAEVLAQAKPGEDLEVLSTWKRDKGWLSSATGVEARVFVQAGRINVIVHDARLDWVIDLNLTERFPIFTFGSRTTVSPVVLKCPGGEVRRPDWVVLSLDQVASAPQATPATSLQPAPPPTPAATRAASVEERLRELKRFREQDLITEAEYVKQKGELLKTFTQGAN